MNHLTGHIVWGCFALLLLILIVDWAVSTLEIHRKERKREADMQKYGLSPFKVKQRDWWLS